VRPAVKSGVRESFGAPRSCFRTRACHRGDEGRRAAGKNGACRALASLRAPIREAVRELASCGSCAVFASRRASAAEFAWLGKAQAECRQAAVAQDPAACARGNQRLRCAPPPDRDHDFSRRERSGWIAVPKLTASVFEFPERRAASVRGHGAETGNADWANVEVGRRQWCFGRP
jgi:hypothetical protein